MAPVWSVYFLYGEDDALLYVGRSDQPEKRKTAFIRKYGRIVARMATEDYADFESASARELEAIIYHAPPFNKNQTSSTGFRGKSATAEVRAKQAAYHLGRKKGPLSEETRAKLSAVRKGRKVSEETRRKLADAARRQWTRVL
jgi:hypothetical protein